MFSGGTSGVVVSSGGCLLAREVGDVLVLGGLRSVCIAGVSCFPYLSCCCLISAWLGDGFSGDWDL
eukprot:NODE_7637_length_557_cov_2.163386_g6608_i0.p5 GENE.NODE_7637_length_557_cov_2.163386_g6608_i0~~NODE_7637_length_557_cov_2.163386_g6608_i0.p5  ORF type:complete len:66 (+),score=8.66 NODE_7637_length_557_cov_2.163386_g6608_i0:269-466(+)